MYGTAQSRSLHFCLVWPQTASIRPHQASGTIRDNLSKEETGAHPRDLLLPPFPLFHLCSCSAGEFLLDTGSKSVRVKSRSVALCPRSSRDYNYFSYILLYIGLPTAWWTNQCRLARHRQRIESLCPFVDCMSPSCRPSLERTEYLRELMELWTVTVQHGPWRLLVIRAIHNTWPPRFIRSMLQVPIATACFQPPHRLYQTHCY